MLVCVCWVPCHMQVVWPQINRLRKLHQKLDDIISAMLDKSVANRVRMWLASKPSTYDKYEFVRMFEEMEDFR